MASKSHTPWERPNPRKGAGKASTHLAPAQKSAAKARARRAGRPYPNLVDNMHMASTARKKAPAKKGGRRAAKKSATKSARKSTASARIKDPHGGLTAAGRKAFARKD